MERCPSQPRLQYSLLRPALPFHQIFPATLQKQIRNTFRVIKALIVSGGQTNGCVICVETACGRKAAITRRILRLRMDSAAKTLSPTAESSMIHHAPRLFLSLLLFLASPLVLFWLFNSAHPIIRNLERTSSRLFLLPGTAVGRTDRTLARLLLRAPVSE